MTWNLDRILNYTVFTFFSVILFCLILLTPVDAIYQCYVTQRLTNIFIITGGYVVTFCLAVLIYATRIYTNRSALSGIPKAWIPIEKEDVSKSVRRLVVEGLARSAIVAYQARPRDTHAKDKHGAGDGDGDGETEAESFADYSMLLVDRENPPWGEIEHPGWSSPQSPDLPDRPYSTVVQELPNLVEAKAVSLAPFLAAAPFDGPSSYSDNHHMNKSFNHDEGPSVPDTRVVDILRRPASMGLREYLQHLTRLNVIPHPEAGAEFLALYERARFSSHRLREEDFRDLMHVFAELLRGMRSLDSQILGEIHGGGRFMDTETDTESVIGPSDEEVDTDVMDFPYAESYPYGDSEGLSRGRSNDTSLRPSSHASASTWEGGWSVYATPPRRRLGYDPHRMMLGAPRTPRTPRTPSMRSLRPVASNVSGSSGGSVIRLAETRGPGELLYTIDVNGNRASGRDDVG